MNAQRFSHLLILLSAALLACCVPPPEATSTHSPISPRITPTAADLGTPFVSPSPLPTPVTGYPVPTGTEAAIADLAERLDISPDAITVLEAFSDEFPAQDLGCPGPDDPEPVQPAFVTGQVIVLQAEGETYTYHAHGGRVRFCW